LSQQLINDGCRRCAQWRRRCNAWLRSRWG
jgi:hypothetical protein